MRDSRPLALASIFVLALSACGSDSTTPGNDGGGPGDDGGGTADAPVTPGSVSVSWGPLSIPAGQENTKCVVKRLGNADMLRVGSIHNTLGPLSHHMIVYRTNATTEQPDPFDCQPFVDTLDPSKGSPLMITQKSDETLELPQGVAFSLEANQMVRLELHYINSGDTAVDAMATSTFIPIAPEQFMYEADFLFIGDPDISIPAHQQFTLGPIFFAIPAEFGDANFFGITGHTHQWGTNVLVSTAPSAGGAETSVYDVPNWNWDEPATVYADPPFMIPAGGGFRFTCEYDNQSNATVGFGESANDEMCFFWAYYYPSHGARVCAHTDQFAGGYDACCPGDPACSLLF